VRWFEEAFEKLSIDGEVHVTDADPLAAAFANARHNHLMPLCGDPNYAPAMRQLFEDISPDLFLSVNDHELAKLSSTGLGEELRAMGAHVLTLDAETHRWVNDKLHMYEKLSAEAVPTPRTILLSDAEAVGSMLEENSQIIIKDRFGSGSSGLLRVSRDEFTLARQWTLRNSSGRSASDFIVQPALTGPEFGLDIVAPLTSDAHEIGVIARVKTRMRSGETDQARTVESSPFEPLATQIARLLRHRGIVDVDVMCDEHGVANVVDINPRFGGGYPFSHLAGADIPSLLIAQLTGKPDAADLAYRVGVSSSKHEAIAPAG